MGIVTPLIWATEALALLELSLGNHGAAWAAAAAATERVESEDLGEPFSVYYLPSALEALIALGELDRAEALLDRFEASARRVDRIWAIAAGARTRALLVAARGDLEAAEPALERALAHHQRTEMPFELARTLFAQGQIRRRRRERRAARESLNRALVAFEELGAMVWAERVREELSRLDARALAPRRGWVEV